MKVRWVSTYTLSYQFYYESALGILLWKSDQNYRTNILKFGYGINYKYEGMLAHSFDKFYVITKFILPTLDDLKLSPIRYNKDCTYIHKLDDQDNEQIKQNIRDLLLYCANWDHA